MTYPANTILDYFGNSELCLGIVTKDMTDRMQVRGATNQVVRVLPKQVLCSYGLCTANNPVPRLVDLQNQISDQQTSIDLEFLWTVLSENPGAKPIDEIANEYFGAEPTHIQISALARALLADSLHFQRNGNEFSPRTLEEIEQLRELRRKRAEKAAWRAQVQAWLQQAIAASAEACAATPLAIPPEIEPFVQQCTAYLMQGQNCEAVNLLSAASSKLNSRELAASILRKTGRFPEDADEFLLVNGIHTGFTADVRDAAIALPPYAANGAREDLSSLEIFSIDDISTREIDDALSLDFLPDGNFRVGIHLANPSCFVHKGDLLDQCAVDRPLSLYLPTTTVTMFPEELGCDAASLNQGLLRPAMSFLVTLSPDAELLDWRISASQVKVAHRLTYIRADELLEAKGDDSLTRALAALRDLAEKRCAIREEAGAVSLNRPEIKLTVVKGEITAALDDQETPSHRLVAEFMILANHLAARYALRNDLPIIYRCQDPPLDDVHSVVHYDPIDFDQQVRKMKRTRLSTYPQPHFGLGLDLYTQVSSPLRRYADMVIQRQIEAHLSGNPPPYTQTELFGILDNVEHTASANRSYDREAKKFWLLEYLRRNYLHQPLDATVVRVEGSLVLAELNDFYERGVVMTRDRPYVGDELRVRIQDVNPKLGRMVLEPLNRL